MISFVQYLNDVKFNIIIDSVNKLEVERSLLIQR